MSYFITHDRGALINLFKKSVDYEGKDKRLFGMTKKGATSLRIAANIKLGL